MKQRGERRSRGGVAGCSGCGRVWIQDGRAEPSSPHQPRFGITSDGRSRLLIRLNAAPGLSFRRGLEVTLSPWATCRPNSEHG
jgi:hypothetical protein